MDIFDFYYAKTKHGTNKLLRYESKHTILDIDELTLTGPLEKVDVVPLSEFPKLSRIVLENGFSSSEALEEFSLVHWSKLTDVVINKAPPQTPGILLKGLGLKYLTLSGPLPWAPLHSQSLESLSLALPPAQKTIDLSQLPSLKYLSLGLDNNDVVITLPPHLSRGLFLSSNSNLTITLTDKNFMKLSDTPHLQLHRIIFDSVSKVSMVAVKKLTLNDPEVDLTNYSHCFPNLQDLEMQNLIKWPGDEKIVANRNLKKIRIDGSEDLKTQIIELHKIAPTIELTATLSCKEPFYEWRLEGNKWVRVCTR